MKTGTILLLSLGFYGNHVLFSLLGIYLIDRFDFGVGDVVFELATTFKKVAVFSLVVLAAPAAILIGTKGLALRTSAIIYLLLLVIGSKLAFLRIGAAEIVALVTSNVAGLALFGITVSKGGLVYIYIAALLIILIMLLTRIQREKQQARKQSAFEAHRSAEIKKIVQRNPNYQTLCYRCKYFIPAERECFRKLHHHPVKEIRLHQGHTYCLYWEPE